ncbi:hypothetical protein EMPG_09634 [Blastomyces silverae]|uniref:Uncharacterized protein n=1 Tax=Blastomyces silverae TaxID=2060906 RepID=A0A0H1BLH3_9EURO|nr:hypothetical protein EMPG_09634 [Blastomyces silverae]
MDPLTMSDCSVVDSLKTSYCSDSDLISASTMIRSAHFICQLKETDLHYNDETQHSEILLYSDIVTDENKLKHNLYNLNSHISKVINKHDADYYITCDRSQFLMLCIINDLMIQVTNKIILKIQSSYICCDMHVDAENYFEFIFSTDNDIFYVNLTCNNIYILSDSSLIFDEIMNDLKFSRITYLTISKSRTILMNFDLNVRSLKLFSCEEIE